MEWMIILFILYVVFFILPSYGNYLNHKARTDYAILENLQKLNKEKDKDLY